MKTYKDIYELPLKFQYDEISSRVVDSKYQFVFQFINTDYLNTVGESTHKVALEAINGDRKLTNPTLHFYHHEGYIYALEEKIANCFILIRGWGNLTGVGAHNLSAEEAINIQDTFAEFIVEQLNKR